MVTGNMWAGESGWPYRWSDALRTVADRAKALVSAGDAGVMLVNPDSWELECQQPAFGLSANELGKFRLPLAGDNASARVARTGRSYLTHDARTDANLVSDFVHMCGTRNMVTFRLHSQGTLMGVVHVTNKESPFSTEDFQRLESVSPLLAATLVGAQQQSALARFNDLPEAGVRPADMAAGSGRVFSVLVQEVASRLGCTGTAVWVQLAPGGPLHRLAAILPDGPTSGEETVVRRALRRAEPCSDEDGRLGIPLGKGTWPQGVVVAQGSDNRRMTTIEWVLGLLCEGFQQEAVIWAQRELLRAVAAGGLPGLCSMLEELLGMPAAVVDNRGLFLATSGRFVYPTRILPGTATPGAAGTLVSRAILRTEEELGELLLWVAANRADEGPSVAALLEYAATLGAVGWPARGRTGKSGELEEILDGTRSAPPWVRDGGGGSVPVLAVASGTAVSSFVEAGGHPWLRSLTAHRDDHGVLLATVSSTLMGIAHLDTVAGQLAATGSEPVVVVDAPLRTAGTVAEAYRQCMAGLRLIRALGRGGGVYRLELLGPARLLLETDPREARRLLNLVRPLQAGPPDRSVMLAQTYLAFMDAGENLERASSALHVHANTLRYRLGKLADLGIGNTVATDRLTLYMALRLFIFLQGSAAGA